MVCPIGVGLDNFFDIKCHYVLGCKSILIRVVSVRNVKKEYERLTHCD